MRFESAKVDERWIEIDRLHQSVAHGGRVSELWGANHQRTVERSLIWGVLRPNGRFSEMPAMITPNHHDRLIRQANLIKVFKDLPDLTVDITNAGQIGATRCYRILRREWILLRKIHFVSVELTTPMPIV